MIKITLANTISDYKLIANLAATIWRAHYTPIIGTKQVEYMLEKYQSSGTIAEQVKLGSKYFIILFQEIPVGYLSYTEEKESIFLSKIYVLSEYRGKSIGKTAMLFVEDVACKKGHKSISLTVNKNNKDSIKAYEKMGFITTGAVVKDIGNGFVMDDYAMIKTVNK